MSNWRLHTPEGVNDLLPRSCGEKTNVETGMLDVFASHGYLQIETPILQFYDVFDTPSGQIRQEVMYKFFDKEGRILVLRPDITTCIARIVGTKLNDSDFPKRFCYSGKVFRYIDNFSSGQREFCQAGIELIGVKNDIADAEVIVCAIEALMNAGLEKFQIEIGQVEFFKGLMALTPFNEEEKEALRMLIDRKDSLEISEYLKNFHIDNSVKEIILKLPTLFGDIDILDKIDTSILNEQSITALNNLKNIYSILVDYGYENYISVDLSLVHGINCYTGMIFRGFTHGVGFPVCTGGRYDGLIGEFGKNTPAVGMSIGTDRLISALSRQNLLHIELEPDTLVFGTDHKTCYAILTALRNQGFVVENYILDDSYENAVAYAQNKQIQGIISIFGDGCVKVHNLQEDSIHNTSLEELLETN